MNGDIELRWSHRQHASVLRMFNPYYFDRVVGRMSKSTVARNTYYVYARGNQYLGSMTKREARATLLAIGTLEMQAAKDVRYDAFQRI